MSLPDNTAQTPATPISSDSDVFTDSDLERASAIFKQHYPDSPGERAFRQRTSESIQPDLTPADRQAMSIRISARELHKYPIGLIGIFLMFLVTYPLAMSRVSQSVKLAPYGFHLKSLTPEYGQSEVK